MPRIGLVLDRADRTYPPGAPVAGTVEMDLADEWPDARLVLVREWRATGHAETDTGNAVEVVLFEGMRPAGRTSHPIALDAPWGPLTHHGTILRNRCRSQNGASERTEDVPTPRAVCRADVGVVRHDPKREGEEPQRELGCICPNDRGSYT